MRKFTFFLAMLVAMVTTSMAQSYELTETRLTSSDLNSKTEPTLIAIKNLSKTNNYWFVGNTGAAPYSAAEFSEDAVFVWEPLAPGVAYCLKKLDGTYMTTVSPATFSAESGAAALFTTTNPTVANGGFNGDGDSMPYIDDEALLVRFTNAAGTWINVQNGEAGTPVYNNGTGGWTIHNVYLVEEKEETVEPEPEPEPEPAGPVVITSVDQLSNSKLYTITSSDAGRGNFYALNSKVDMCAVTYNAGSDACHSVAYNAEDPKQQFAFVNYEDKFYLYSVSEKKFVAKNGDVNQLTAEAPFEFVVVESVSENTFSLMLNGTNYMTASPGWCANPSRGTCLQTTLTSQSENDGWDAGAWYTITEVGTFDATEALAMLAPAAPEPEPTVQTFAVNAYLFPTPQGDVTEIQAIRVEANQGPSLSDLPIGWTFTNEAGEEFEMDIQWMYDFEEIFISFNPSITEAGTYTLTIPAGSLKTDDGKECEAATFSWTIEAAVVEPEPEVTYYRIKTTTATGDAIYLNIGNTDEHQTGPKGGVNIVAYAEDDNQLFTIEEAAEGWSYLKSKSGYYIKGWEWNVDGSADQKTEIKFEDAGDGYFYILNKNEKKGAELYFKVEWVGDNYYPFCDVNGTAGAAKWTLEQVAAPEPELPALEITGYTPTEAVESLETITITFNDEIEGTFDMMAMSQIYLGSKSNGCSFAVEGNVLTITPFNAITTPGEYALVIPEGLITRKANGEAIALNGEIVFTVVEPTPEPEPEPEVVPAANKSYTVVAEGHNSGAKPQWAINDEGTKFVSTGDNVISTEEQKQFAFVAYEENTYLYSVSAKKFVMKDATLSDATPDAIEIVKLDNGKFFFRFDASHNINIGGSKQMIIDTWNIVDGGNQYTLNAVADFDATEALELLAPAEPELPALEITGYTPTEAVESLETITITFNDEIEGTFDTMAMSQIYLGSKSNGCSFAVEGNVLTITPFNAITTPGEYALVIPEGLITRKANGEAIALNGEIVFTVVEPTVPVVITSVDQLSNSKLYTIVSSDLGRGGMFAGEGASLVDMCGVTYNQAQDCHSIAMDAADPRQQFAFVEYKGKHYLYSVSEKKFVAKNGNVNKLTAEAPFEFVVVESVSENTFALMLNGTHYMTASPGWCSNAERNTCIQTTLTDHNPDNGWDNGAWYTITEVGEFDATEAIAMLTPAEPEVEPLEVVSISPADGETVEKLEQIVVTFNAPVTLDETKNINLVGIEGSDVTPIEAYVGTWQLFSSFPEQEGYFVTGTTEIIEYQGQPALLCKGFADMAAYGYDDSFIMFYNSEDGSVTLPAQSCENFEYYGTSYEVGLYLGNSTEVRIFDGKLIGNYVDGGVIIFESSPENENFADSFMFYSRGMNSAISYFNDLVWMPVSQAAAPAKAAVRNNVKVECAKNLSVATIAKSKVNRAEENVASIVSASINPDDATQLIITVNQPLANDTYKLVIEAGAVVTAEGATNETIICTYILNDPTSIDEVKGESGEVKAIYDLTGRKIETITKGGIYIVNGKKVLVK